MSERCWAHPGLVCRLPAAGLQGPQPELVVVAMEVAAMIHLSCRCRTYRAESTEEWDICLIHTSSEVHPMVRSTYEETMVSGTGLQPRIRYAKR